MFGYLAVVRADQTDDAYFVEFPDLPGCTCDAPTVDEALSNAEHALRHHAEALEQRGRTLPKPRPSHQMIAAAAQRDAVAAACLRAPAR
jgi:predicted RNase H-like HicB family nuclease